MDLKQLHAEHSSNDFEESDDDADSVVEAILDKSNRQITEYFKIFDQNDDATIAADELGNFMRCLRINVKQRLINDIKTQLINQEKKSISIEHLRPRLLLYMQENKFEPPNEKTVELAFKTIEDGHEPLTKEHLEKCLKTQGEQFSSSEWTDMVNHLLFKKNGEIDWRAYIRDVFYIINKKFKI